MYKKPSSFLYLSYISSTVRDYYITFFPSIKRKSESVGPNLSLLLTTPKSSCALKILGTKNLKVSENYFGFSRVGSLHFSSRSIIRGAFVGNFSKACLAQLSLFSKRDVILYFFAYLRPLTLRTTTSILLSLSLNL